MTVSPYSFRHRNADTPLMGVLRLGLILIATLAALLPAGCTSTRQQPANTNSPIIRVRLLASTDQVLVTASETPTIKTSSDAAPRAIQFPRNQQVQVQLRPDSVWTIGGVAVGTGEVLLQPGSDGS